MSDDPGRPLSNSFLAVRLIALHERREEEDKGYGPFLVAQRGIDPQDPEVEPDDFLLTRGGAWLRLQAFLEMGWEEGREAACFPNAAAVMMLLEQLPPRPQVERPAAESRGTPACGEVLPAAVLRAIRGGAGPHPDFRT